MIENTIKHIKFDKTKYDEYVQKFIRLSEERNKTIAYNELRLEQFDLPDARWFVTNCPDPNIDTWSKFVDWCGFVAKKYPPSKEKAIKLILEKQNKLQRPLIYDDFRNTGCYDISITYINKVWGSLNKMKEELGLEITQDSMIDRMLSKNDLDNIIIDICNYIKLNGKDFITERELVGHQEWRNTVCLSKYSKIYYNCSLPELLEKYGFRMGKPGKGMLYKFEDGEVTNSQFEYMFSKFIRDNGFEYNKTYFRDVKYSTFIKDYHGCMNCDYVIHLKKCIIYIEIAGMIAEYKKWYYQNKPINKSKSKEKYRLKLKHKEKMLKENNLIYYILFPCDLTIDNFNKIINEHSLELKYDIENFMCNNIDWIKVRNIGELNYNQNIIRNTRLNKTN